jgi:hypothetical protein
LQIKYSVGGVLDRVVVGVPDRLITSCVCVSSDFDRPCGLAVYPCSCKCLYNKIR